MPKTFKLNHAIAENVTTLPKDILAAKRHLYDLGFYEPPEWGITQFPDRALIDAIRDFQRANGLRVDGVMKPDGKSEFTIQQIHAAARRLQGMGRHGDTLLAHITPAEAKLLKSKGGAGTTNPATGMLEFYKAENKQGTYIWRTVGDGKVRSSHAERDGKTFSWAHPPEGGHPGEAPNCRCWAEDVKKKEEEKKDCEDLNWKMIAAWDRHDDLHGPIETKKGDIEVTKEILKDLKSELIEIKTQLTGALISSIPSSPPSKRDFTEAGAKGPSILQLLNRLKETKQKIEIENYTLAKQQKELEQL